MNVKKYLSIGMAFIFTSVAMQISLFAPKTVYADVQSSPYTISTVAGTGTVGYSGDGGSATSAELTYPYGVAVDSSGNIYLTDSSHCVVRKVDTSGKISTIAGTGMAGYSGDGGLATEAKLNYTSGIAVDSSGNVYISDVANSVIRKIDTTGIISTIAGTGTAGYSGDGGLATSAKLYEPGGITVDSSGNVYVCDMYNNRIRKIDTTGIISTIAGTGTEGYSGDGGLATSAELNYPNDVEVDNSGNIYIADTDNNVIRKIDTTGKISTIAGIGRTDGYSGDGGLATSTELGYPYGIALDSSNNIYISDTFNNVVRKVDTTGKISTIAGTGIGGYSGDGGIATIAELNTPLGIAVDSKDNVYVSDYINSVVRKLSHQVSSYTVTYNGNGSTEGTVPVDSDTYTSGTYVAVRPAGNLGKTGCTFVGWNTEPDGTGTSVAAGGNFNISENTTLYAQWNVNPPVAASGLTVTAEKETPVVSGKVTLTVIPGVDDSHHVICYRIVDSEPTALNVGEEIEPGDGWIELANTNVQEITVANGKYIEAVEVTTGNYKVTKWGKSSAVNDGYVASASLSRNAASFDKNPSNQADVSVDMTLNGNTLISIANGIIPLINGIDYTANENTVTISKSYLASLPTGTTTNLAFNFSAGSPQSLNITVTDTTPAGSSISPISSNFDKNAANAADVNVSMALNKYELGSILPYMFGVESYLPNTLEGNTVTIKKSDLGNLTSQSAELRFYDDKGNVKNLDVSMSVDNTGVNLNMALVENIISGTPLTDITNEGNTLVKGTDYIVNGSTVTIKRGFLTKVGTGTVDLVFSFGTKKLSVTMSTNETDLKATMTLYGNTLIGINNGVYTLVRGTDYTVNGNVVTIKKSYLETLSTGTAALVFNFSEGSPQTLNVAISDTTPINYTATFKNYDGSTIGTQTVVSGNKITAPVVPERTGYTFEGWYKESACQNKWNFVNSTVTSEVTLYAKWTINNYTVTFKDYDGKTIGEPQTVNYGESAAAPAAPTRTGYVFAGWDKSYNDVTGDLVVTAKYTSGNTYPFQPTTSNGGDETKISTDYLKSRDNTLVINNTAASLAIPSSAIDLVNGADHIKVTEKVVTPEANTVQGLFGNLPNGVAKMVGNPISLNVGLFDASDALIQDIHEFSNNQKVKVTIKLTSAQIAGLDTSKLSMYYYDETSRTWVELGGSFNTNTMEFTFYTPHFTNFAIMNKASTPTPSTGNTTPAVTSYTVTFKNYDGTVIGTPQAVNYGGSATAPAAPTRTGYVFAGWDKAFDKVTGDLVVTAKYTSGNTYNFKPTATSNGAETKISSDYLTSRDNTLVINSDGAEISIPAGAIDSTDGTSYIKVIEQSDTAANISNQFGNLPKGLKQVGNPLLLSIELFDANNNYIKNIHKLANNEKIKVTMKFTADELKGIDVNGPSMYYYDETAKAWAKLEGKFNPSTREMTFYMTEL